MKNRPKPLLLLSTLTAGLSCASATLGQTGEFNTLWLPYLLEADGVLPTYGTSVAVDPQGGIHASYSIYAGADRDLRPALYAYCPRNPAERANWSFVRLGQNVQDCRRHRDPFGLCQCEPVAVHPAAIRRCNRDRFRERHTRIRGYPIGALVDSPKRPFAACASV